MWYCNSVVVLKKVFVVIDCLIVFERVLFGLFDLWRVLLCCCNVDDVLLFLLFL